MPLAFKGKKKIFYGAGVCVLDLTQDHVFELLTKVLTVTVLARLISQREARGQQTSQKSPK